MKTRALVFGLLAGLFAQASSAATLYMVLDGRWYAVNSAPTTFWADGYGYYMPAATAGGCVRSDGQGQDFGNPGLYLGQFFFPVYRITSFSYRSIPALPGKFVVTYHSEPGNIVCDNQIPDPTDVIFRNGYEVNQTIFASPFEATP